MADDFKNEAEVKQYLENLGNEYRFGCFSEKKPEVCHLLGDYLEAVKEDFQKASKIYKSNCDDYNFGRSCYTYGNYAFIGKTLEEENREVAYNYFIKACDLGIAEACFNAGLMCVSDNPKLKQEIDYKKGMPLLKKSCDMKNNLSCYYLSGMFISGSKDQVVKKDMKEAFKYSEKACDLGNMYACSNLSLMYRKGEGIDKNEELAVKFSKKAADLVEQHQSNETDVPNGFKKLWAIGK